MGTFYQKDESTETYARQTCTSFRFHMDSDRLQKPPGRCHHYIGEAFQKWFAGDIQKLAKLYMTF